jgi:hypothetical protein
MGIVCASALASQRHNALRATLRARRAQKATARRLRGPMQWAEYWHDRPDEWRHFRRQRAMRLAGIYSELLRRIDL